MSTISVMWLRLVKKYFRAKSRIIGSLGQPLLFLLVFGFGFGTVFQQAGRGDYIQFLAPGIIMMSVLFTSIFSGIDLIWDRQFGFLKETLVAPVPRWQIMLGQAVGGATVASLQGIIVFLLSLIVGLKIHDPVMLPAALLFMFLVALLFTSVGISIASLIEDMQGFQLIMSFLVMPIFFLSGALFPLEGLPEVLDIVVKLNPLTYGVDGMRQLLINSGSFAITTDFMVIAVLAAALVGVGTYLFKRMQA
jgi:ABC-2 type transport system permease protein